MSTHQHIPYEPDNSALFSRLEGLPWAVWLDSQGSERWEIMSALPCASYYRENGQTAQSGPAALPDSPFPAARALFQAMQTQDGLPGELVQLPFHGGILGYWGYSAANPEPLDSLMPPAAFGWYNWFITIDHEQKQSHLIFRDACPPATRQAVLTALATPAPLKDFRLTEAFAGATSQERYSRDIQTILDYIHAGDCYQVNYTQAFSAPYTGSPWAAYRALRADSRSPYSAYMSLPFGHVLSLSPEQFLEVNKDGVVQTKPIKGTRPRFPGDPVRDAAEAQALLASPKDRAENVMITDLLRNDLGIHAIPGSVKVEKLCALESFSLVHHLVSTITARLRPGSHPLELLRDAFPGGSITGAPKKRAMEIIAELESTPRSVYCGSIGYMSADGRLNTSIAIRTLVCRDGLIRAWAGGGITADSVWEDEYQECLNKIGGLLQRLEAMQ